MPVSGPSDQPLLCFQPVFVGCVRKSDPGHHFPFFGALNCVVLGIFPLKKKKVIIFFMLLELSTQSNVDFKENISCH